MANRVKLLPTIAAEIPNLDVTILIGADATESVKFSTDDIGKALKISSGLPDSRMQPCEDGDEINAQLISVEPNSTSGGYRVATARIVNSPMFTGVNSDPTVLAIGDEVVATDQAAVGTPNAPKPFNQVMRVKKAPATVAPAEGATVLPAPRRLRVVAIQTGTGGQNSLVTLSNQFY